MAMGRGQGPELPIAVAHQWAMVGCDVVLCAAALCRGGLLMSLYPWCDVPGRVNGFVLGAVVLLIDGGLAHPVTSGRIIQ